MKFTISTAGRAPDLDTIERALMRADPSAVVDLDPADGDLRFSTLIREDELIGLLNDAGYSVSFAQLVRAPSECCGGCGG